MLGLSGVLGEGGLASSCTRQQQQHAAALLWCCGGATTQQQHQQPQPPQHSIDSTSYLCNCCCYLYYSRRHTHRKCAAAVSLLFLLLPSKRGRGILARSRKQRGDRHAEREGNKKETAAAAAVHTTQQRSVLCTLSTLLSLAGVVCLLWCGALRTDQDIPTNKPETSHITHIGPRTQDKNHLI